MRRNYCKDYTGEGQECLSHSPIMLLLKRKMYTGFHASEAQALKTLN